MTSPEEAAISKEQVATRWGWGRGGWCCRCVPDFGCRGVEAAGERGCTCQWKVSRITADAGFLTLLQCPETASW